jgi:alkanesulfonate monooxygenase SsuD/methylene tetrahydromethanopterin reductase-like flavin-dependent oxidoreductase (luciferase family)
MNSPNLIAALAAQRTSRLKLLIYGNLLPPHQPLWRADESAMLDCLSVGRWISGLARVHPCEYRVHHLSLPAPHALREAFEIVTRAWSEKAYRQRLKLTLSAAYLWPSQDSRQKPSPAGTFMYQCG